MRYRSHEGKKRLHLEEVARRLEENGTGGPEAAGLEAVLAEVGTHLPPATFEYASDMLGERQQV